MGEEQTSPFGWLLCNVPCILDLEEGLAVVFGFYNLSAGLLAPWSIVPCIRPALTGHYLLKWLSSLLLPSGATLRCGSLHPVLMSLEAQQCKTGITQHRNSCSFSCCHCKVAGWVSWCSCYTETSPGLLSLEVHSLFTRCKAVPNCLPLYFPINMTNTRVRDIIFITPVSLSAL